MFKIIVVSHAPGPSTRDTSARVRNQRGAKVKEPQHNAHVIEYLLWKLRRDFLWKTPVLKEPMPGIVRTEGIA